MPTRSGRTGQAFTRRGTINIRNARHAHDPRPLDGNCDCPVCTSYARGYIHHLFKAEEMLGPMLLTAHNLRHYQALMAGLRAAIEAGRLEAFAAEVAEAEMLGDVDPLPDPLATSK
jgi:queuine tRNA-ribosyltransferase